MKYIQNGIAVCLLLASVVFCTGCPQRQTVAGEVAVTEAVLGVDSIVCYEGCAEYTCYFAAGSQNKKVLENIRSVIFGGFDIEVDSDDSPEEIDRYRKRYLDSLSRLEWLDSEPWPALHSLYMKWSQQQLERYYIVSSARRNPAILSHCSETDSVLVRCEGILTRGGDGFVGAVRQLWTESEYAKAARDSVAFDRSYLERTFERIDEVLSDPDSVSRAREHLSVLLSNHINQKIHDRLGKNGTVDFYSYADDFFRIFDNVKVVEEEP